MKNLYQFLKSKLNIDRFVINRITLNKSNNNIEIEIFKFDDKNLKSEILAISFDEINNLDILSEITQYLKESNNNSNFLNLINKINYQFKILLAFVIFITFLLIILIFNAVNTSNIINNSLTELSDILNTSNIVNNSLTKLLDILNTKPKYIYRIESFEDYEFRVKINELGNDGWELVFARRALRTKGFKYDRDLGITEDYEGVYECIFRKKIN
jgi:hypothetical protein